jgi:hypothetical protein
VNRPCWSTAATCGTSPGQPLEVEAQNEHLQRCRASAGRGFVWRCGAETIEAFVHARFVTTVLGLSAFLAGFVWLVL